MQVDAPEIKEKPLGSVDVTSLDFLSRMSELVPGIIYVFNHKTNSNEYSNRSIAELLGYSPQELLDMGDALMEQCVHEEDLPGLVAYFASLNDLADGAYSTFEYRDYAKDGSVVWLRSIDTVFDRDKDGSVIRHLGIAFDITAEKDALTQLEQVNHELEERVRARTAELEALNRELGRRVAERTAELEGLNHDLQELTYIATHDLKVPVSNINSLTHMLSEAEPLLPPEHVETLGWLRDVSGQASEKLDTLVCVAQAQSDRLEGFDEVDLETVTERALVHLHFQITRARAVITTSFEQPTAWFVPHEMENILQSMIGNAIKYSMPDRRPRIEVRSRQWLDRVEISIQDNGTGLILPQDREKVFGLFKRAHTTPDGAGVSLYSIRRLLQRAGGSIDVTSEPGRGSCFAIFLPNRPEAL